VQHTLDELKSDVFGLADPRPLLKSHPWLTLASAAVAGFTAAQLPSPPKTAGLAPSGRHPSRHERQASC